MLLSFRYTSGKWCRVQQKVYTLFSASGALLFMTTASIRESIVLHSGQVSWLVTLLPSFSYR